MRSFVIFLLFISVQFTHAQIPSWATKTPLGNDLVARHNAAMLSYNSKLYILGGYNSGGPKDFTEYNPTTGEIKKLPNLTTGSYNPLGGKCFFEVKGKFYYFNANGYNVYDPNTNIWEYSNPGGNQYLKSYGNLGGNLAPDAGFVINDTIFLISSVQGGTTSLYYTYFYSYNIKTDKFNQRANLPSPSRTNAVAFAINGRGYSIGGGTLSGGYSASFYEYIPDKNQWKTKIQAPLAFSGGIGVSYNGKGYIGLGIGFKTSDPLAIDLRPYFYEYNPSDSSWTKNPNFLNASDNNVSGRYLSSAAVLGNELHVFGGSLKGQVYFDDIYNYSFTNESWSLKDRDPGQNRSEAFGFYANGKLYAGAGQRSEGCLDFWQYDLATDIWTQKSNSKNFYYFSQIASIGLNNKGYLFGGYNAGDASGESFTDSVYSFDPTTDTWKKLANFPGGKRSTMVVHAYNGKIYAGMGRSNVRGENTTDYYEYNPATNTWAAKTNAPFGGSNRNYFTIGDTAYVLLTKYLENSTHLMKYSFLSNTWTSRQFNNLSLSTSYGNQAYSYNGKGYALVGSNPQRLAEYNPSTGTWTNILNMPQDIVNQTIIPVSNNGIYFAFGYDNTPPLGVLYINSLSKLTYNAGVSKEVGLFASQVSTQLTSTQPIICGSGFLNTGMSSSISDQKGDLFATIINVGTTTSSNTPNVCLQVSSKDTLLKHKVLSGKFGSNIDETVMILNKSFYINGYNQYIAKDTKLSIYLRTTELQKFVQSYNNKYNSDKTIDSLKVLQYYYYGAANIDSSILNNDNSSSNYKIYKPVIKSFGTDKVLELNGDNNLNNILGELYVVLKSKVAITTDLDDKVKPSESTFFYPNPSSNKLNFIESTHYQIINSQGVSLVSGEGSEADISYLNTGIYFIKLGNRVSKFVKE